MMNKQTTKNEQTNIRFASNEVHIIWCPNC